MQHKAELSTVLMYALFVIPFIIAALYALTYIPIQYETAFNTIPALHASILAWSLPHQINTCSTTLQKCTQETTPEKIIQQLPQLLSSPEKLIGIHYELPNHACPNNIACEYNSDQQQNPRCATQYKGGWCAYEQLAGSKVQKQLSLLTQEHKLIHITIRTAP